MRGYSLAEVMLAVALAAVVVLTLVALSLTSFKGNQKSSDLTVAQSTAHQWIEEELYAAQQDAAAPLWSANNDLTPYKTQPLALGNTQYEVALYATDINDPGLPNLKRCRMRLSWWGGDQARQGYGRMYTEVIRFVSRP